MTDGPTDQGGAAEQWLVEAELDYRVERACELELAEEEAEWAYEAYQEQKYREFYRMDEGDAEREREYHKEVDEAKKAGTWPAGACRECSSAFVPDFRGEELCSACYAKVLSQREARLAAEHEAKEQRRFDRLYRLYRA